MSLVLPPMCPPQAGHGTQQRADQLIRALNEQRRLLDAAEACVRQLKCGESLAGHREMIFTLTLLARLRERN